MFGEWTSATARKEGCSWRIGEKGDAYEREKATQILIPAQRSSKTKVCVDAEAWLKEGKGPGKTAERNEGEKKTRYFQHQFKPKGKNLPRTSGKMALEQKGRKKRGKKSSLPSRERKGVCLAKKGKQQEIWKSFQGEQRGKTAMHGSCGNGSGKGGSEGGKV